MSKVGTCVRQCINTSSVLFVEWHIKLLGSI